MTAIDDDSMKEKTKKKKKKIVIGRLKKRLRNAKGRKARKKSTQVKSTFRSIEKYWFQRYDLFSRYDEGIQMDEEGWFSVTPEEIAIKQADRCTGSVVIDAFAGVGGNAIQFARKCHHVIAIDIDPRKVELAINNAKIYGVEDCIDFIVGDFFQLAPFLKGDVVFLSPPWGGPSYKGIHNFTLDLLKPKDGRSLFQASQSITPNIMMFLPRNVDLGQVEELSWLSSPPLNMQIEESYANGYLKGMTVYYGDIAAHKQLDLLPPFSCLRGEDRAETQGGRGGVEETEFAGAEDGVTSFAVEVGASPTPTPTPADGEMALVGARTT